MHFPMMPISCSHPKFLASFKKKKKPATSKIRFANFKIESNLGDHH